jgi:hypothetical protein
MQNKDPDAIERSQRVRVLCRELGQLVELSREQRRTIDELLERLEGVMRSARLHRIARGAWRSVGSSRG